MREAHQSQVRCRFLTGLLQVPSIAYTAPKIKEGAQVPPLLPRITGGDAHGGGGGPEIFGVNEHEFVMSVEKGWRS